MGHRVRVRRMGIQSNRIGLGQWGQSLCLKESRCPEEGEVHEEIKSAAVIGDEPKWVDQGHGPNWKDQGALSGGGHQCVS